MTATSQMLDPEDWANLAKAMKVTTPVSLGSDFLDVDGIVRYALWHHVIPAMEGLGNGWFASAAPDTDAQR